MLDLRPLIVLTGTVHVEGGLVKTSRTQSTKSATRAVITEDRTIDPARQAANVVATDYMRRIRQTRILRTPFGVLYSLKQLVEVKELIASASADVVEFNRTHKGCRLLNTLLWEHLRGTRLDAVAGWIECFKTTKKDISKSLPQLLPE